MMRKLFFVMIVVGLIAYAAMWYRQAPSEQPVVAVVQSVKPLTAMAYAAIQKQVEKRFSKWELLAAQEKFVAKERLAQHLFMLEEVLYSDAGSEHVMRTYTPDNIVWWRQLEKQLSVYLSEAASYAAERNRLLAQRNEWKAHNENAGLLNETQQRRLNIIDKRIAYAQEAAQKGEFLLALERLRKGKSGG